MKQHYKTLGLQEGASQEEIEAAYKRLSKELDPANNDNQEFFIEEYKKLQQAYKALSASSILATKQGAKNVYSKPKEENSLKDEPANTKPPKNHTNKTKVIVGIVIGVFIIGILVYLVGVNSNFQDQNTETPSVAQKKIYKVLTIAFYNVENLFDTKNNPTGYDINSVPNKNNWTKATYNAKLKNIAKVISEIGADVTGIAPAIIGLNEIENREVLEDLIRQKPLLREKYGIIHFNSPDNRGLDVALLYKKKFFTPTNYKAHELIIFDNNNPANRIFTRDQLVVSGLLDGEKMHFIVNHWPSRIDNKIQLAAAKLNRKIIDSILSREPMAKIITMGDLNINPTSSSIKNILKTKSKRDNVSRKQLFNPMEVFFNNGLGTFAWRDRWYLFDQMILSSELTKKDYTSYRYYKGGIFNKSYLANSKGQYKGYPFNSFRDGFFTGGYSDHFPVFLYLVKEQ